MTDIEEAINLNQNIGNRCKYRKFQNKLSKRMYKCKALNDKKLMIKNEKCRTDMLNARTSRRKKNKENMLIIGG